LVGIGLGVLRLGNSEGSLPGWLALLKLVASEVTLGQVRVSQLKDYQLVWNDWMIE